MTSTRPAHTPPTTRVEARPLRASDSHVPPATSQSPSGPRMQRLLKAGNSLVQSNGQSRPLSDRPQASPSTGRGWGRGSSHEICCLFGLSPRCPLLVCAYHSFARTTSGLGTRLYSYSCITSTNTLPYSFRQCLTMHFQTPLAPTNSGPGRAYDERALLSDVCQLITSVRHLSRVSSPSKLML